MNALRRATLFTRIRGSAAIALMLIIGVSAQVSPATAQTARDAAPRIVNIINFVRQCEPRIEWITEDVLYSTVVEQLASMKKRKLTGTFLLQYDALVDPRYQSLFKQAAEDGFEIGAWWEIPQPLVEDAGLKWRGRYRWDWHADVGFATGYSPEDRVKLIDTYMARFKEVFGATPKSVGSWFIDAHTLGYLSDRYGIDASCNCKDQIGTDGYTLWGGYWNQGYYPSRRNAYMPAQTTGGQIPVPTFRMLGSDPIHQYDNGLGTDRQRVVSLEPIYDPGGANPAWCRWYFDAFVNGEPMGFAYTQVGQENSFTWRRMGRGFDMQMDLVAKRRREGEISIRTLGETGRWFKKRFPVTPPTSVTVLTDHSDKGQKTVWFNSRYYRANLLWDDGTLRFRDVHLFDETIASRYLEKRGASTRCLFNTLPVVDGFRWSSTETTAGLRVRTRDGKDIVGGTPEVTAPDPRTLLVRWPTHSPPGSITLTFDETRATITAEGQLRDAWMLELTHAPSATLPFEQITAKRLTARFESTQYVIEATRGRMERTQESRLRMLPQDGQIALDFAKR